ncbi:cytochrome P450 [Streptomyces albidoflavus]|uniref:cytochrome P450 n=1 Tax=Streptomyces TaxID=1883 RepID=UPI001021B449|nr:MULTISPECIES: cytochrome P450 [Streptomyces]QHC14351.1 cytochrome P450 [Streptomyces sp. GF20]RZD54721.1 cytochrome P450 [Streptomyces albidoflavus]
MSRPSAVGLPTGTEPLPDFPQLRQCPYQPPPGYRDLRLTEGPVVRARLYDGRPTWVVLGHAVARELLIDPRLSSDWSRPDFPSPSPRRKAIQKATILVGMDPPEHSAYRRKLIPAFSVRRTRELGESIHRRAGELVDAILQRGTGEILHDLALPLSSHTICGILGVPYEDHAYFEEQSALLVSPQVTEEDATGALMNLRSYLTGLVERKEKEPEPGDGLLDTLVYKDLAEGSLSRDDVIRLGIILLMAGHETTASMITLSTFTLLQNPAQLAAFRDDPAGAGLAVEELLRYLSIGDVAMRIAAEDITVGDAHIRAGDSVMLSTAEVNRDPDAFDEPDALELSRGARHHLAFGYGVHQCIGQNLARAEMESALTLLFGRIPGLRLAVPAEEVEIKPAQSGVQGIYDLPVTW